MKSKMISALGTLVSLIIFFSCTSVPKTPDANFLGDFNPIEVAKIMAGTVKRTKNEIKPAEISFVFAPRNNMMSFHHKSLGDNIWVHISQKNRADIINAMENYLEQYNSRNLSDSNAKVKAFFGKTKVSVSWGLLGAAHHVDNIILRSEYRLITNNRPYFILAAATAEGKDANSPAIAIALSPSQCKDFIEILKQDNLKAIVEDIQKEFDKYDIDDAAMNDIESKAKESGDGETINYDEDFE